MPRRYSMARRAALTERTRDGIEMALIRLLAKKAYEAITMGDIAREADVSVRTVQRHFGTKDELMAATLRYPAAALAEELSGQPPADSAQEDIHNLVAALFAVYRRHRAEMWVAYSRAEAIPELLRVLRVAAESSISAVEGFMARWSHRLAVDPLFAKRMTIALTSYPVWRGFTAAGGFGAPEAEDVVARLLSESILGDQGAASAGNHPHSVGR